MAEDICPVWVGYLLASPVRKLWQSPRKILEPFIKDGDTVLDIGCALGFFSIPLAEMVGEQGRVVCLDVQEKMLAKLKQRAAQANVLDRIDVRLVDSHSLKTEDLKERVDFALAFSVLHEVPDQNELFREIFDALKWGRHLLVSEPNGHVSQVKFAHTVLAAKRVGFKVNADLAIAKSRSVLFEK